MFFYHCQQFVLIIAEVIGVTIMPTIAVTMSANWMASAASCRLVARSWSCRRVSLCCCCSLINTCVNSLTMMAPTDDAPSVLVWCRCCLSSVARNDFVRRSVGALDNKIRVMPSNTLYKRHETRVDGICHNTALSTSENCSQLR